MPAAPALRVLLAVALGAALSGTVSGAEPPAMTRLTPWPPPVERVTWIAPDAKPGRRVELKLLGFNDFHGNLLPSALRGTRKAGGAAGLAAYLAAAAQSRHRTLIIHAGDHVGASPPLTRLLQNEPSIQFLNLLANPHCVPGRATRFFDAASWRRSPNRCNVIGTLGNHEFDAGTGEIRRLLDGGNAAKGPYLDDPWRGSRVPYVSANVLGRDDVPLLPPYAVVVLGGVPVGVIGAVLRETATLIPAGVTAGLQFLEEAAAINRAAAELKRAGIHTLIVTIHQGMVPVMFADEPGWDGPLRDIIAQLDEDIDVVIAGHQHNYTNALFPNRGGLPVLVTQAYKDGVAYADIDLAIDTATRDVVRKSAVIVPTWVDAGPGLHPEPRVAALTESARQAVASRISRRVGETAQPITRALTPAGESALGNLVADAQRAATRADIALTNQGGLRADLPAGEITLGDVLTVHPYGNRLVTYELSGEIILALLEEQWQVGDTARVRMLKTSGLYYVWDAQRPAGHHVVMACDALRRPLVATQSYRVTVNDFLAAGGDDYRTLTKLPMPAPGPEDSEVLTQYLERQSMPTTSPLDGRILRSDGGAVRCDIAP